MLGSYFSAFHHFLKAKQLFCTFLCDFEFFLLIPGDNSDSSVGFSEPEIPFCTCEEIIILARHRSCVLSDAITLMLRKSTGSSLIKILRSLLPRRGRVESVQVNSEMQECTKGVLKHLLLKKKKIN